jgi:hypothetical protein
MENIKKFSGDVLLYLYARKREKGFEDDVLLRFDHCIADEKVSLNSNTDLTKDLLKITQNNDVDLYNSLQYLHEKGFIFYKRGLDTGGESLHNFHVTAQGVDIIEGVDYDEESRNNFNINFNIKLADNVTVESLIKNELGSLAKFALI